ncbi:hypothetical protein HYT57_03205 [Candidatus Woesearchaeota archaeon]|nr:hypothetical protein [Candidatus Woesearchaeota archaeon]
MRKRYLVVFSLFLISVLIISGCQNAVGGTLRQSPTVKPDISPVKPSTPQVVTTTAKTEVGPCRNYNTGIPIKSEDGCFILEGCIKTDIQEKRPDIEERYVLISRSDLDFCNHEDTIPLSKDMQRKSLIRKEPIVKAEESSLYNGKIFRCDSIQLNDPKRAPRDPRFDYMGTPMKSTDKKNKDCYQFAGCVIGTEKYVLINQSDPLFCNQNYIFITPLEIYNSLVLKED